jgi:hypothetical protein
MAPFGKKNDIRQDNIVYSGSEKEGHYTGKRFPFLSVVFFYILLYVLICAISLFRESCSIKAPNPGKGIN